MTATDIVASTGEYVKIAQPLEADVRQRIVHRVFDAAAAKVLRHIASLGERIADDPTQFRTHRLAVLENVGGTNEHPSRWNAVDRYVCMIGALDEATFQAWHREHLASDKHNPTFLIFAGARMLDDIERNFRGLECAHHPNTDIRHYSGFIYGKQISIIGPIASIPDVLLAVDEKVLDPSQL